MQTFMSLPTFFSYFLYSLITLAEKTDINWTDTILPPTTSTTATTTTMTIATTTTTTANNTSSTTNDNDNDNNKHNYHVNNHDCFLILIL